MKKIIEHIYYGLINESERHVEKTEYDEIAIERREALLNSLTEQQKQLFEDFYESNCLHFGEMEKSAYERGFKTGIWLGLEVSDFSAHFREE